MQTLVQLEPVVVARSSNNLVAVHALLEVAGCLLSYIYEMGKGYLKEPLQREKKSVHPALLAGRHRSAGEDIVNISIQTVGIVFHPFLCMRPTNW